MADNLLDLNALAPEARKIKFGEQIIEVQPPKTVHVLKLSQIGAKMQQAADLPTEELEEVVNKLQTIIGEIIPELKEVTLTTGQLMAIMTMIVEMGMPEQAKELAKKGITVDGSPKAPQN